MKSSKTWLVWAALVVCAATILAAMTWQTSNAVKSEHDRIAAEDRADLQERMRLALWRMDSLGATLVVDEINGSDTDWIRSRFEWNEANNALNPTSPELRGALDDAAFPQIFRTLNRGEAAWKSVPEIPQEQSKVSAPRDRSDAAQKWAGNAELQRRSKAVDSAYSQNLVPAKEPAVSAEMADATAPLKEQESKPSKPAAAALGNPQPRPVWIGDQLFLLKAILSPQRSISGSWLDVAALEKRLLAEAADLLPAAKLVPATSPSNDGLVLASFPLRLEPGTLAAYHGSFSAPITLSLVAGWSAAVLAILAAALLVFGVMRLSERRASFVSAVTHELRTPLTTFRLYSDMLESGAVKPEKRGQYLRVLSREADRLSHLVENVLAFSGIERGSARSVVATIRIADLLEPMRERLEARLASAEMSLEMSFENPAATLRVDTAAIEHILFNLIDNAAKYAAASQPPIVEISTATRGSFLEIHVTDHGPGIAETEHRRIFRAFHKSAREAAETKPGVGLGLALSRRLARGLRGDLTCEKAPQSPGARFVLSLPVSRPD